MNAFPLLTEFLGFDPAAESDSEERVNNVENNEVKILEDSPLGDEKEYFVKRQIDLINKERLSKVKEIIHTKSFNR